MVHTGTARSDSDRVAIKRLLDQCSINSTVRYKFPCNLQGFDSLFPQVIKPPPDTFQTQVSFPFFFFFWKSLNIYKTRKNAIMDSHLLINQFQYSHFMFNVFALRTWEWVLTENKPHKELGLYPKDNREPLLGFKQENGMVFSQARSGLR